MPLASAFPCASNCGSGPSPAAPAPRIRAGDIKKAEKALEEGIAHNAEPIKDLQHAYDKLHQEEQAARKKQEDDAKKTASGDAAKTKQEHEVRPHESASA